MGSRKQRLPAGPLPQLEFVATGGDGMITLKCINVTNFTWRVSILLHFLEAMVTGGSHE